MLLKRLLFISFLFKPASAIFLFQNISCYCLSKSPSVEIPDINLFQNISCYCLSQCMMHLGKLQCNFKTSLVIVYLKNSGWTDWTKAFQNISCYCLSIWQWQVGIQRICISKHLMLLFIDSPTMGYAFLLLFQNISCYCLSIHFVKTNSVTLVFQNISCYCLSLPAFR